jgi:hypothetical protein
MLMGGQVTVYQGHPFKAYNAAGKREIQEA